MEDEHPLNTNKENKESAEQKPAEQPKPEPQPVPQPVQKKPKQKKSVLWPALTVIFALLFVISLLTNGFHFGGGDVTGKVTAGDLSAIILNDERCEECDTTNLVINLKQVFPNLEINEIDYSSEEGKELYDETGVINLPAVLFTEDVKESSGYGQVSPFLVPAGEYLSLRIGADFDPEAEICDNGVDDTGNDLVDCEDPDCEGSLLCRKEKEKDLQLFVMSQCPYGTMALNSMEEVLEAFEDDDISFDVHYIATEMEDGTFQSLHGQPEVDENIRQLCAKKYYETDNKYMEYIWCRNEDISSEEWENCAFKADMSTDKIKACSEGDEGAELLAEDIKIAQELKISASPSWIANNKYQFSGIDAETIKLQFCEHNPDLEGCGEELSENTEGVEGQC